MCQLYVKKAIKTILVWMWKCYEMCCQMVTVARVILEALTEHPATQLQLHFKGCRYIQNNLRGFCASIVSSVYAENVDHPC